MRKFKTIFILQPTHDFSKLVIYASNLRFLTTGKERQTQEELKGIKEALVDFDPAQDAIVTAGRTFVALLTGTILQSMFQGQTVTVGLYITTESGEKDYKWQEVKL